jgi:hypothetical protein
MSLSRLWAFLAVTLPALAGLIAALQTVDLTYHLRAGGEILDTGAIPAQDTWTFTAAGAPWTDQQWGAQVLFALVYRLGAWTGLVILRAALSVAIFGSLFLVCRHRGLGVRAAAWLTLGAFVVAAPALALRPQLIGMALFAVTLLLVAGRHRHPQRLWLIPVLTLIWANVHGSFFLVVLALGLAWLEDWVGGADRPHRILGVAGVAALAACVTPFGPVVWSYAAGLTTNPEIRIRITEWQPTSVTSLTGLLFYGSALLVSVGASRLRRWSWPAILTLAIFFAIGAYAERGVAWWPLVAVATMAGLLATAPGSSPHRAERREPRSMRRLNAIVAGAIVLAGLVALPVWRPIDPGTGAPQGVLANAPSGVTAAVRDVARPGDRLLNPQVWGSWFEFAVPDLPVAIDSRIELFPPELWDAYDAVLAGRGDWERQLDEWSVTVAVVQEDQQELLARLLAAGWHQAYADMDGIVLTRPG